MRLRGIACGFCFLSVVAVSAVAEEGIVLRLKPEPGVVLPYRLVQEQTVKMDMGPVGVQTIETNNTIELHQTVRPPAKNGDLKIDLTYDRLVVESAFNGQGARFDTADPPGDSPLEIQRVLIDKPVSMQVTPRGEIVGLSGLERIWESATADLPTDAPTQEILQQIRTMFGEDAMLRTFQQVLPVFPKEKISAGSTWEHVSAASNGAIGDMTLTTQYQAQAYEEHQGRSCMRVAFKTQVELGNNLPIADQMQQMYRAQGLETNVAWKMDAFDGAGRLWVDRKSGTLVDMQTDVRIKVAMNMSTETPDGPQALNIAVLIDQTMKLALQGD